VANVRPKLTSDYMVRPFIKLLAKGVARLAVGEALRVTQSKPGSLVPVEARLAENLVKRYYYHK
jgi:hypothetical protein